MFKIAFFILVINLVAHDAAVIRISDKSGNVATSTLDPIYIPTTTLEPTLTTPKDQDLTVMTTEKAAALTRDEEATILIVEQTLLDSEPAELVKPNENILENKKSEKLLLLSTPKIAEKSKQLEEDLEESEEEIELAENMTEMIEETTTTSPKETSALNINSEINTQKLLDTETQRDCSTTEQITKLFPINDTLYADTGKNIPLNPRKITVDEINSSGTTQQEQKMPINVNYGSFVLEEPEADYVLAETELFQGSYTDVDSDLHLQPIVQSLEVVPSSLDNSLFVNYVHIQ